jgi:hypothetical protein
VGENEDDDEKNEREHAGKPQERLHRDACLRGRHLSCTLHGPAGFVKPDKRTIFLTPSDRPFTLGADAVRAEALEDVD